MNECPRCGRLPGNGHTEICALQGEIERLRATISRLREYINDCATNWDCDEDAHTYRTTCRKCDAEALLAAMAGGENGN